MKYKIKIKKVTIVALFVLFQVIGIKSLKAEIKLPAIVSSNMVLQRNTTIEIWGWADANEKIELTTSWLEKTHNITTDKDGNWKIEIKTTNSKQAQKITLKSKNSNIVLENILFGEVWLCSGQSNMQQPIKGFNGQPTFGSLEAVVSSYNPNLRLFTVGRKASKTPLKNVKKHTKWQEASTKNVPNFSAIGYFFGQQLQKILDVPVGLIHTSWGGSSVEAWMSKEVISQYQKVNLEKIDITKQPNQKPTLLFNAMIHPIVKYKIKGTLWYQGEANRAKPNEYKKLFPAMVKDWRTRFNIGDFPFYYVQIAPFSYDRNKPKEQRVNSAFIREAQLHCLDLIPNSGIAIAMDIGDEFSIHPPKKKEVADRLLYNALNKTYGYKNINYASPIYDSFKIQKNNIKLSFKNLKNGLYSYKKLDGFEIAGADKVFYPAEAKIVNRNKVVVKSDKVKNPVAVRYAWKNWFTGSLYGTNLLPVSSFRTDNWSDATKINKK
jgi:sialate O-acetylesterase